MSHLSPKEVAPYLQMLNKLGFPVTGDPKYTGIHSAPGDAVSAWQAKNGGAALGEPGVLTPATQAALRDAYKAANNNKTYPLELESQPQILAKLGLDKEKTDQVLDYVKNNKGTFAGEAAVKLGMTTQKQLDAALLAQTLDKAGASVADNKTIAQFGHQDTKFLRDNWGNNGVNKASDHPSRVDAVSAAANAAQNMVVLANKIAEKDPEAGKKLAKELAPSIEAAHHLANGIAGLGHLKDPSKLMGQVNQGLRHAAETAENNGVPLQDSQKKPVKVEDYIAERSKEMKAGIEQQQAKQHERHAEAETPHPGSLPSHARAQTKTAGL